MKELAGNGGGVPSTQSAPDGPVIQGTIVQSLSAGKRRGQKQKSHTLVVKRINGAMQPLLQELLASSIIVDEEWELLAESTRLELARCSEPRALIALLVKCGLLTEYQAARIESGKTYGLMLNNYRVLDRIGACLVARSVGRGRDGSSLQGGKCTYAPAGGHQGPGPFAWK